MTEYAQDRLPPQNREAERGLLSAMMTDPSVIPELALLVRAEDLYFDANQKLFQAMLDMSLAGKPVDSITLAQDLRRRGQLEDIGGHSYLADIWDAVPTAANSHYHAKIVRSAAINRSVIHLCNETIRDAFAQASPADELLSTLEAKVFELAATGQTSATTHVGPIVIQEVARLDTLGTDGGKLPGITTGIRQLDEMTGGWREGFYALGARPGLGKSALMLTFALNAAMKAGVPVLIFSLEMPAVQIVQRQIAMVSGVNLRRIRGNDRLENWEYANLGPATDLLQRSPIYLNDTTGIKMPEIQSIARQMISKHKIGIVFIDYAQLIEPEARGRRGGNRAEDLEGITRRMKLMSRSLKIPVVALAQVGRGSTERAQERPKLSDFKGSGGFEQDADDCYLLWRDPSPDDTPERITVGLDVAKQRNGPTGEIRLRFNSTSTIFEDYTVEAQ